MLKRQNEFLYQNIFLNETAIWNNLVLLSIDYHTRYFDGFFFYRTLPLFGLVITGVFGIMY